MSDTTVQEKKMGTIASSEFVSKSEAGWKRYDVSFTNGESFRALVPADCNHEIATGDELVFFKGRYNSWVIDRNKIPGAESSAPSQGSNGKPSKGGRKWSNTDYWRSKFEYEVETVNPRLEFQGYCNNISAVYAACISTASKPVDSMTAKEFEKFCQRADQTVDSLFAKGKEFFRRVNKADVEREESDTEQTDTDE